VPQAKGCAYKKIDRAKDDEMFGIDAGRCMKEKGERVKKFCPI
jgi:hypothetical protein